MCLHFLCMSCSNDLALLCCVCVLMSVGRICCGNTFHPMHKKGVTKRIGSKWCLPDQGQFSDCGSGSGDTAAGHRQDSSSLRNLALPHRLGRPSYSLKDLSCFNPHHEYVRRLIICNKFLLV